jgi:hypothetical protein
VQLIDALERSVCTRRAHARFATAFLCINCFHTALCNLHRSDAVTGWTIENPRIAAPRVQLVVGSF